MEEYLSTKEIAQKLKKTPNAIRNMVHRGTIPYRKCGGTLFFIEKEVDELINNSPGKRIEDFKE